MPFLAGQSLLLIEERVTSVKRFVFIRQLMQGYLCVIVGARVNRTIPNTLCVAISTPNRQFTTFPICILTTILRGKGALIRGRHVKTVKCLWTWLIAKTKMYHWS